MSTESREDQGATLTSAQLQGATLISAELQGADLSAAYVWRTDFTKATVTDVAGDEIKWKPVSNTGRGHAPWTKATYEALRGALATLIPEGMARRLALTRIKRLDCEETRGKSDCIAEESHPQFASVTPEAHAATRSKILKALVCDGDTNAIHILRGLMNSRRLGVTGANDPRLIDAILKPGTNADCPVSAMLTAADKSRLLEIKQEAEKAFQPKPEPEKKAKKR